MKKRLLLKSTAIVAFMYSSHLAYAQTLFVPNATTTGIANSTVSGNVGIGLNNPAAFLHILTTNGNATPLLQATQASTTGNDFFKLINGTSASNTFAAVLWGHNTYTTSFLPSVSLQGSTTSSGDVSGSSALINLNGRQYNGTTGSALINRNILQVSNYATSLFVIGSTGRVGIGVTTPNQQLHIATSGTTPSDGILLQHNGTAWAKYLSPSLGTGAYNNISRTGDAGIIFTGGSINSTASGFVLAPWRSSTSGLRMDAYGNVGIGTALTNNPNNYMLAVNGTIGAKAVRVEITSSTWSDYVFEPNYKLMSLSEVEKYVQKNKHLPEVPSAAEVEDRGIDIADMDNILLRKIEELTLYMIEMKKENEQLKSRLEAIEKK